MYRKLRGIAQQRLADEAHLSKSLLSKVEAGYRPATPAFIAAVARVLQVNYADLTGQPYHGSTDHEDRLAATVTTVRQALLTLDLPTEDARPSAVNELTTDVAHISALGRKGSYIELGQRLPALYEALSVTLGNAVERQRPALYALLAEALSGASVVAGATGQQDLRNMVLDRIQDASHSSGDPLRVARTRWSRTQSLQLTALYDRGLQLMDRTRHDLGGDLAVMDDPTRSIFGVTLLRSAVLSARSNRIGPARDYIAAAQEVATRTGDRNDYGTEFGPTNTAIHAVAVEVESGNGAEAIDHGERLRLPNDVAPTRAARHWIDMARAYLQLEDRDKCLQSLLQAEWWAPQLARNHPAMRETTRVLVRLRNRSDPLRRLANRIGYHKL